MRRRVEEHPPLLFLAAIVMTECTHDETAVDVHVPVLLTGGGHLGEMWRAVLLGTPAEPSRH